MRKENQIFQNLKEFRKVSNNIQNWILASRPKTLFAAVSPVVVGGSLAFKENKFNIISFSICLACAILIQIATNFVNDLYDHLQGSDDHTRTGPVRAVSAGLITPGQMKKAVILTFLLTFLLGLILVFKVGYIVLLIGICSIIAGYMYTAGSFPLAYNGLGDIFVFIFFGLVATAGTYYVNTQNLSFTILIFSAIPGLLITNILVVNNYRDYESDKLHKKNTLIALFGKKFGLFEYLFLNFLAIIFTVYLAVIINVFILLPLILLPLLYKNVRSLLLNSGSQLNKTLADTSFFSFLFSLLISIGILL